jgi:predicted nucleotidyltransferase
MSVMTDRVHASADLRELFAAHKASSVKVFDLPKLSDYIPDGGIGFYADFEHGVSLFDVLELEGLLEDRFGRKVLVMTGGDKSYYVNEEMIANAKPL